MIFDSGSQRSYISSRDCNALELFPPTEGGIPGGIPYKKDGLARRKFCKEPLRGTKALFCGLGLKMFSTLLKVGEHVKAVLRLLNTAFLPISRSRFKRH